MKMNEVVERCALACEAEAISLGLPGEAGREFYIAAVADDLEGWSEDQYLAWVEAMEVKYQGHANLLRLYNRVSEIMGSYAPLLKNSMDRFFANTEES